MANDFTIADVLEWARTKPAGERYNYYSTTECALARFLKDTGRCKNPFVCPYLCANDTSAGWREDGATGPRQPYPYALEAPLSTCETFGELVAELVALVPAKSSIWLTPQTYIDADIGGVGA